MPTDSFKNFTTGVRTFWVVIATLLSGVFVAGGVWVNLANMQKESAEYREQTVRDYREIQIRLNTQSEHIERLEERSTLTLRALERLESKTDRNR